MVYRQGSSDWSRWVEIANPREFGWPAWLDPKLILYSPTYGVYSKGEAFSFDNLNKLVDDSDTLKIGGIDYKSTNSDGTENPYNPRAVRLPLENDCFNLANLGYQPYDPFFDRSLEERAPLDLFEDVNGFSKFFLEDGEEVLLKCAHIRYTNCSWGDYRDNVKGYKRDRLKPVDVFGRTLILSNQIEFLGVF